MKPAASDSRRNSGGINSRDNGNRYIPLRQTALAWTQDKQDKQREFLLDAVKVFPITPT